jgi:hypothetical protein
MRYFAPSVALLLMALPARADVVFTFDNPGDVVLGSSQAPGVWYPDRYPPAGFASGQSGGGRTGVLDHFISANDKNGSRPPPYNSGFYDYQGRKYDLPNSTKFLSIEMYVPQSWASLSQKDPSGNPANWGSLGSIWATGFDATNSVSAFPIIGFNNTAGSGTGGFQVFDSNNGWTNVPGFAGYDQWYKLSFALDAAKNFDYFVNGSPVYTDINSGGTTAYFGNVILQGYNGGNSYHIFWDNFRAAPAAPAVPEPTTLALFGLGTLGLAGWRLRRKHAPQ